MSKRTILYLSYFGTMLTLTLVRVLYASGAMDLVPDEYSSRYFTIFAQLLAMGAIPLLTVLYLGKRSGRVKGEILTVFKPHIKLKWQVYLIIIGLGILQLMVNSGVSSIWSSALELIGFKRALGDGTLYNTGWELVLALFFTAMLPAIFEEITHRGVVLHASNRGNIVRGVLISALLFALMHQNITQTGYTFVGGLFFALVAIYSGSIIAPMIMHFINNAVSIIGTYSRSTGGPFAGLEDKFWSLLNGDNGMIIFFFISLFVISSTLLLFYLLRKYRPKSDLIDENSEIVLSHKEVVLNKFIMTGILVLGIGATIFSLIWGIIR